ncbi:MAG: ATP-binding protein [Pseudomonadota bacterium]
MHAARYLRDAAVFAPCYIALDWASYIAPLGPFNITPWNPQPALAVVWMLLGGLHHAPVVAAAIYLADVLVREVPGGYGITAVTALVLAGGYAGIASLLRFLLPDLGLRTIRQLTQFAAVVVAGTALVGTAFVGVLRGAELLAGTPVPEALLRFWIGDAVGILVTAPLLLVAADAERRKALANLARRRETLAQLAALVAVLWLVFAGLGGDPSRHFYLLFAPLIWVAARGGMVSAVVASAVVQIGVMLGIRGHEGAALPVVELQALVATFTLTGLYLGMTVDERARAVQGLRHSLRLAAAGEMAGAIAHEVNQPLTALANYGRSAQMLLKRGQAREQVPEVIEKMLAEAGRASEVVRRLRDFFRSGTTRLEPVPVEDLFAATRRIGQQLIGEHAIAFEARADPDLPALFVDRLQIELVLRNLIANAVESLTGARRDGGRIRVSAEHDGEQQVRIVVADNGPGISAAVREELFQPFVSGKPTGMGLGLAVSRAIAEAHGGSLDARPGEHGEFRLVLPCVQSA